MEEVLQFVPHAIGVFDKDLKLTYANKSYRELLKLSGPLAEKGAALPDIVRHNARIGLYGKVEEDDAVAYWIARVAADADQIGELLRPDGSAYQVEKTALPDGGFILTYVDITDVKDSERALEDKSRFMEAILQNTAHGISIFDDKLNLIVANPGFLELYGYGPKFAEPGTPLRDIIRNRMERGVLIEGETADRDIDEMVAIRLNIIKTMKPDQERIFRDKMSDGRTILVRRLVASFGAHITTYTDITETERAHEALRASERKFRSIVDDQTDLICRFDGDFVRTFVNSSFVRAHGRSEEELLGGNVLEFVDESEREDLARGLRSLTPDNPVLFNTPNRRILPNGDERWFEWTNRAIFDDQGGFLEYQAVGRDITEEYLAESSLRQSEARHRAIVEDQNEMICRFDTDLRMTFTNQAYQRFFSPDGGSIIGHMVLDLIPAPESRAALEAGLRSLTPEVPVFNRTFREISGGKEYWHRWANRALFDEEGQLVEYQAIGRDITGEKLALDALEASEQRFRGVVEAHPVPVLILDRPSGDMLYASPAAVPVLGPDLESITALKADDLFATGQERERFSAAILDGAALDQAEFDIRTADGRVIPTEVTVRAVDYQGCDAIALGVVDISDRKRAEQEIARQRASLAQSEKMSALGSLLASVAHELNNPLSIIVGQGELLELIADDSRVKERAERIRLAADRCARIVGTFLSMARQKAPTRKPTDLAELTDSALELAGSALKTTDIAIDTTFPEDLPSILADADQLMQVVLNLVINAQHALAESPPPRSLSLTARMLDEDNIEIRVEDNGPGVPADLRERIFEPFFTTKAEGLGTGIGLSVCHSIMSSHGGTISIGKSKLGGAAFVLTLPTRSNGVSGHEPEPLDVEAWAEIAPQRILVVDDEVEVAETIKDHLEPDGHSVSVARNGREALERLGERSFDIVLSDLRMPELDGPGFYQALTEAHLHPLDRIGFLTGDTLSASARDFLARTPGPYLEKPFKPDDLRQMILGMLRAAEGLAGDGGTDTRQ